MYAMTKTSVPSFSACARPLSTSRLAIPRPQCSGCTARKSSSASIEAFSTAASQGPVSSLSHVLLSPPQPPRDLAHRHILLMHIVARVPLCLIKPLPVLLRQLLAHLRRLRPGPRAAREAVREHPTAVANDTPRWPLTSQGAQAKFGSWLTRLRRSPGRYKVALRVSMLGAKCFKAHLISSEVPEVRGSVISPGTPRLFYVYRLPFI
ncbi:hypothetical protein F4780DRAFT_723420 [Xylariomycetidae sp. FL0641]|nr:hypothetical protein F4780DRAFT_723420 [Xylariomycetidae sp. FL0641]